MFIGVSPIRNGFTFQSLSTYSSVCLNSFILQFSSTFLLEGWKSNEINSIENLWPVWLEVRPNYSNALIVGTLQVAWTVWCIICPTDNCSIVHVYTYIMYGHLPNTHTHTHRRYIYLNDGVLFWDIIRLQTNTVRCWCLMGRKMVLACVFIWLHGKVFGSLWLLPIKLVIFAL